MRKLRLNSPPVAYHEAGHAVAQWRFGFKIKEVTIVPDGEVAGSVSHKRSLRLYRLEWEIPTGKQLGRYHDLIVTTLAWEEAQRRFRPRSVRRDRSAGDYRFVNELLLRLHGEAEPERLAAFRYLQLRARHFVNHPENWLLIEALAKALLERQMLSGEEVKQVILASFEAQLQETEKLREADKEKMKTYDERRRSEILTNQKAKASKAH
jgi:hypothetical protein